MTTFRLEKFILASLLGMIILLTGAALFSKSCKTDTFVWNQQIQSSANFGSVVASRCRQKELL